MYVFVHQSSHSVSWREHSVSIILIWSSESRRKKMRLFCLAGIINAKFSRDGGNTRNVRTILRMHINTQIHLCSFFFVFFFVWGSRSSKPFHESTKDEWRHAVNPPKYPCLVPFFCALKKQDDAGILLRPFSCCSKLDSRAFSSSMFFVWRNRRTFFSGKTRRSFTQITEIDANMLRKGTATRNMNVSTTESNLFTRFLFLFEKKIPVLTTILSRVGKHEWSGTWMDHASIHSRHHNHYESNYTFLLKTYHLPHSTV